MIIFLGYLKKYFMKQLKLEGPSLKTKLLYEIDFSSYMTIKQEKEKVFYQVCTGPGKSSLDYFIKQIFSI